MTASSTTPDGRKVIYNETQKHWLYEDTGVLYIGPLVPCWEFSPDAAKHIPAGNVGFISMLMHGDITAADVEAIVVDQVLAHQVNSAICIIKSLDKALTEKGILQKIV